MGEGTGQPLLVALPQQLAASHLKQCQRHLQESNDDALQLLYAAQSAHMALHTTLMEVRYGDAGIHVAKPQGKNQPPKMLEEGVQLRGFRDLIKEINISDQLRSAIGRLTDIRDRLQHPAPGPMGYEIECLVSGIEAAVIIQKEMWVHPIVAFHSDDVARHEALAAATAVLHLCLQVRQSHLQKA